MRAPEFEKIFRSYYLALCMYALRITGSDADAEDAVADAFLRTWQAIEAGADIGNPKAYLYRAVRNCCADIVRRSPDCVGLEGIDEPDAEAVDTSERDAAVWRAVDALPPKCRRIFLLSKRDGLSIAEISDELGIADKTVKNQLTKAMSRIREALAPGHRPFFLPFL